MSTSKEKLHRLIDLIPPEENNQVESYLHNIINKNLITVEKLLEDLSIMIKGKLNYFKGIYLYGSRVKGNYTSESDIDVIILFEKELTSEEETTLAGIIAETEYRTTYFIDYHPYTIEALKKNPIYYDEVVNKGIFYCAA